MKTWKTDAFLQLFAENHGKEGCKTFSDIMDT